MSIKVFHIDSKLSGPNVLITAGVHGDEYEPMIVALQLSVELNSLLIWGSITIVPLVNTSAFEIRSRYGSDGLDLARICPGNSGGSSTQRAAAEISELIEKSDYYIDMHTGGFEFEIYPLAGYLLHSSSSVLEKQQEMAISINLPLIWGTEASPSGRTLSIARDAQVPAIYLEYGGGTDIKNEVIKAYKDGVINVLKKLRMIAGSVKELSWKKRYWVEDHILKSGFLQGKMPAPSDGIFITSIKPGDFVKKNTEWGILIDFTTGERIPIYTEEDGLAFMIRKMAKVNKGDSLGGVLPIVNPGKIVLHAS